MNKLMRWREAERRLLKELERAEHRWIRYGGRWDARELEDAERLLVHVRGWIRGLTGRSSTRTASSSAAGGGLAGRSASVPSAEAATAIRRGTATAAVSGGVHWSLTTARCSVSRTATSSACGGRWWLVDEEGGSGTFLQGAHPLLWRFRCDDGVTQ
jgi:hypothetical protein